MSATADRTGHQTIMAAGWTYRANHRGWMIYRDAQTGVWYTRSDAIEILENEERYRPHSDERRHPVSKGWL